MTSEVTLSFLGNPYTPFSETLRPGIYWSLGGAAAVAIVVVSFPIWAVNMMSAAFWHPLPAADSAVLLKAAVVSRRKKEIREER